MYYWEVDFYEVNLEFIEKSLELLDPRSDSLYLFLLKRITLFVLG